MTDDLGDRLAAAIDAAAAPVAASEAKRRGRRQARRRAAILVSITVAVLAAAGVAVANATTRSTSGRARIFVGEPSSVADRTWCTPVSRSDAIDEVLSVSVGQGGDLAMRAKLVSRTELLAAMKSKNSSSGGVTYPDMVWVVELQQLPITDHAINGLGEVDATGSVSRKRRPILMPQGRDVITYTGGSGTLVNGRPLDTWPWFDVLPDHSSACPTGTAESTTTVTVAALPTTAAAIPTPTP
jgi:hypothetical protein